MVKAFLLDLDGTLIDTHDLHFKSFKPLLLNRGLNVKPKIKNYFGMVAEEILSKIYPQLSDDEINSILIEKRKLFIKQVNLVTKQSCADELLIKLKGEGLLALASCSHNTEVNAVIKQLSWVDYFNLVISCYDVKNPKPAPDIILEAVKRLRVSAVDSVYIGDSI
jgi:beta-phosphoglucomutase-like phosphatase (HAD superfamily)